MKLIAIIMMLSMGFLGLNRFTLVFDETAPSTELPCHMDCCGDGDACCCKNQANENDQEPDDGQDKKMQCSGGCDCSYSVQIIATGIHFQSPVELTQQAFDYGSVRDLYQFEYLPPHFQPPRMV